MLLLVDNLQKENVWAVDNWYQCSISGTVMRYGKGVACAVVHAMTRLKGVSLLSKSLLSRLVQEPSFYVIPGLRYEGKDKLQ